MQVFYQSLSFAAFIWKVEVRDIVMSVCNSYSSWSALATLDLFGGKS